MEIIKPQVNDLAKFGLQIVNLVSAYARECGVLKVNPEYVFKMCMEAAQSPDMVFMLVTDGGKVVGYIMGAYHPELFTGIKTAFQYGFFMKKSHRHFIHKLIKAFENEAKQDGCEKVCIHIGPDAPKDRWARVLDRSGYKIAESSFTKEV